MADFTYAQYANGPAAHHQPVHTLAHEVAYAVPFWGNGHYTIGSLDAYLKGYVDHSHQDHKALLTNMIDFAVDNMSIGMDYIDEHPSPADFHLHTFFDDTVRALILSKSLSQNGY